MSHETLLGFDSAWANKNYGSICSLQIDESSVIDFQQPELCRFSDATKLVNSAASKSDYILVAIDQPTIVPNSEGCRPVEKVASSIVKGLKGGVLEANRGKLSMFGDNAPIWRFLDETNLRQNPRAARIDATGKFLIEVFPALSLPSIARETWMRKHAAKYNPANPSFKLEDWMIVVEALIRLCNRMDLEALVPVLSNFGSNPAPRKPDQDRLDALICLIIAFIWRKGKPYASMAIGDASTGYMITPVIAEIRECLEKAAELQKVPVNWHWNEDADHRTFSRQATIPTTSSSKNFTHVETKPKIEPVDLQRLRSLLIRKAQRAELITYGEVAKEFGVRWSPKFGNALFNQLTALGFENTKLNEPPLMALVVNESTGMPGHGFFKEIGLADMNLTERQAIHKRICDDIFACDWEKTPTKNTADFPRLKNRFQVMERKQGGGRGDKE